jgi:hypothetical protein
MLRLQPITGDFKRAIAAAMMKAKPVAAERCQDVEDRADESASGRFSLRWSWPVILLGVVLISAMSLYITLLTPDGFGYYNDDAIYLTTAKSLATSQGYRIISLPNGPAQTKYPPVYPFLLSLVWRLHSGFPANLTALMMVSVLASAASAILAWFYLTTHEYASRWLATLAVGLAAINGFTVVFSIGLFSEMPYMALSIAALLLTESRESSRGSWSCGTSGGIALGVLLGLAFLTRLTGVTLIAAVALYFILRKRPRRAVLPLAIAAMFMLGWAGWCYHQPSAGDGTNATYFTSYFKYTYELFRDKQAARHYSSPIEFCLIVKNNALELARSAPLMALGYCQERLGFVGDAGRKLLLASAFGLLLILLGARKYLRAGPRLLFIYMGFYVSLQLILPYPDSSIERYLVPILPFLILLLLKGGLDAGGAIRSWLARKTRVARRVAAAIAALPVIALAVFVLGACSVGVWSLLTELKPRWADARAADAPFISWINANTRDTDVLACVHHGMYYLYTGRRAVLSFPVGKQVDSASDVNEPPEADAEDSRDSDSDSDDDSKQAPQAEQNDQPASIGDHDQPKTADQWLHRILVESKVTYLIITAEDFSDKPGGFEFEKLPGRLIRQGVLKEVYGSPDGGFIYRVM